MNGTIYSDHYIFEYYICDNFGRVGCLIQPLGKQKNQASLASEWSYRFSVNKLPLSRFPLRQRKKKGLKAEARNYALNSRRGNGSPYISSQQNVVKL